MNIATLMDQPEATTSGTPPITLFGAVDDDRVPGTGGPAAQVRDGHDLQDPQGPQDLHVSQNSRDVHEPRDAMEAIIEQLRDGTLSTRTLGALGEEYAAAWLRERGWSVLDRNWRSRYGELDVVALTPEKVVVFVEVKTRRTMKHGLPQEAVTYTKQANLRRAGVQWLLEPEHRIGHHGVRFDVVTVVVRGGRPLIHHIPGAF